ncbi:HNH endonuclease [Serratia oryzae]|uniref:HNH endonuclease n=1 Tax=Serratia oryzae TaxID=2034155 RepID=UPI0012E1A5EB|nr:HNH endonuclease [Serratia oryzae]
MQLDSERCIFCSNPLVKGSVEHVFPSALGGRVTTTHATCESCNNAFSEVSTGAVEIALANDFIYIRNALNVWSGRGNPPPTIKDAGQFDDGVKYDLAPNLTPIVSKSRIPSKEDTNNQANLDFIAQDISDAQRILGILEKRGIKLESINAKYITTKAPIIRAELKFNGNKIFRAIAKIAVVSYIVLYGNLRAISDIYLNLRKSIISGSPDIANYCGWDYINDFPTVLDVQPHEKSPDAVQSGFDHRIFITNVNHHLVAYINLFGGFNFSVLLGNHSAISPKCLALNPTLGKSARFNIKFTPPVSYIPKNINSFKNEHKKVWGEVQSVTSAIVEHCQKLSRDEYIKKLSQDLMISVQTASDPSDIDRIVRGFCEKLAHVENGKRP